MIILNHLKKSSVTPLYPTSIAELEAFVFKNPDCTSRGINKLPEKIIIAVKNLLKDPQFVKCIKESHKISLGDSAAYFFDKFDKISDECYVPTFDDIVRARVKTIGISEMYFNYKSYSFMLNDVGGQKSERKKWIGCFKDVDLVLFVASLTEYNKNLAEDGLTNRMSDSLQLFKNILKVKSFDAKTSFALILNKSDLFQQMLHHEPITTCFPDYKGPNSFEECASFIQQKFLSCNEDQNRYIYSHITCATDTSNVDFLFNSVTDTLIRSDINKIVSQK